MLNALAMVGVEVLLDLTALVRRLVDRDANLAAWAGHRLGAQPGQLAFDVEVADLAKLEQALVEHRPLAHAPAVHVVRQMVDLREPGALGAALLAGQPSEVDVVDGQVAVVAGITVDQVDQRIADALDRRNVELHRPGLARHRPGAELDGAPVRGGGILDAKGDRTHARTVDARKGLRERVRLGVDDEIDIALAIERDVLLAMGRHRAEAHPLEQRPEPLGIGRRVLDELEAVGLHRVVP